MINSTITVVRRATGLLLLCVALGVLAAAGAKGLTPVPTVPERVCYSAAKWGPAPDTERPCYTVERLFEDGSGSLVVGSAAKRQARCTVPNVTEERGVFYIHCERIGGGR